MSNTSNRLKTSALAFCFLIAGTYMANAETGRFMNIRGAASMPVGHQAFCAEYPAECRANRQAPVVVKLNKTLWNELLAVNATVNRRIRPVTDAEFYGVEEYWTYPKNNAGDCEEYVLEKQRELISRGWPRSALLITVVKDRHNAGHAVLTVRTDKGDIILDNQLEVVLPWYSTPYRFVKRQSERNPASWTSISDTRVSTVASIGN